jgi:ATP-binding cassette, subfamily G (WHITE), member 2, PDR
MLKSFKGEVVYNQEVDKHFPHLTVGETLEFAAACRTPHDRLWGLSRKEHAIHVRDVALAIFGLSHTVNTKVGNDFVRGVSGGERKRVSIAEMALSGSPIACWDNSTRGLDAATALEFIRALRTSADLVGSCHAVAIYQASQDIYDQFDKVVVLYEGREVFYGLAWKAKRYFEDMGWFCPQRQTTSDFLTSVTNPSERRVREGFEAKVPRTADEFEKYWKSSPNYASLLKEINQHESEYPIGGPIIDEFRESRQQQQSDHVRPDSSYTISIPMQIRLCVIRAYQRLWNDKVSTLTTINGQIIMALIIGSIFYGTPNDSQSFFSKGSVLFFATLLNALISLSEINQLYDQRPIVEKQASYALVDH